MPISAHRAPPCRRCFCSGLGGFALLLVLGGLPLLLSHAFGIAVRIRPRRHRGLARWIDVAPGLLVDTTTATEGLKLCDRLGSTLLVRLRLGLTIPCTHSMDTTASGRPMRCVRASIVLSRSCSREQAPYTRKHKRGPEHDRESTIRCKETGTRTASVADAADI